jgi:hypothetical protein
MFEKYTFVETTYFANVKQHGDCAKSMPDGDNNE